MDGEDIFSAAETRERRSQTVTGRGAAAQEWAGRKASSVSDGIKRMFTAVAAILTSRLLLPVLTGCFLLQCIPKVQHAGNESKRLGEVAVQKIKAKFSAEVHLSLEALRSFLNTCTVPRVPTRAKIS